MFLLLAQGIAQTQVDVPILHRRPSKIVSKLKALSGPNVQFVPNDETSALRLIGRSEDIQPVRDFIGLFDNVPMRIRLAVRVESPLNHTQWKGEVQVDSEESWTSEDAATGVKLTLAARLNDDATCTLSLKARAENTKLFSQVSRIKLNEEQKVEMKAYGIYPESKKFAWVPKISVTLLDD